MLCSEQSCYHKCAWCVQICSCFGTPCLLLGLTRCWWAARPARNERRIYLLRTVNTNEHGSRWKTPERCAGNFTKAWRSCSRRHFGIALSKGRTLCGQRWLAIIAIRHYFACISGRTRPPCMRCPTASCWCFGRLSLGSSVHNTRTFQFSLHTIFYEVARKTVEACLSPSCDDTMNSISLAHSELSQDRSYV